MSLFGAGRGATTNETGRFEPVRREAFDDHWDIPEEQAPLRTEVTLEKAEDDHHPQYPRRISVSSARSNPLSWLRAWLLLLLRPAQPCLAGSFGGARFRDPPVCQARCATTCWSGELAARGLCAAHIALGTNNRPATSRWKSACALPAACWKVLARTRHPVGIVTKSGHGHPRYRSARADGPTGLAKVAISLTTLDPRLSRKMEPSRREPGSSSGDDPASDQSRDTRQRAGGPGGSGDQRS